MCMFASRVERVSATRILAVRSGDSQTLVYDARVTTPEPNAMILPVPVRPGTSDAVRLIDLSAQAELFDWLAALFPSPLLAPSGAQGASRSPPLPVERVGSFEASLVPSLGDLERIDARFVLAPSLVELLAAHYGDHAFVVYQIAPGEQKLHPFAVSFVSRYSELFFPALHVHDGAAPPSAQFDHDFYTQHVRLGRDNGFPIGRASARNWPAFLDRNSPVFRQTVSGWMPNRDLLVPA
jgi:hypothetical protein